MTAELDSKLDSNQADNTSIAVADKASFAIANNSNSATGFDTHSDWFNILQLTDLHLSSTDDLKCRHHFEQCLQQALNDDTKCDLILITGDLVNEVKTELYDQIFTTLEKTGIPFACIAGNHDVTDELNKHLPFNERTQIGVDADRRLLSQYTIDITFHDTPLHDTPMEPKNSPSQQASLPQQWRILLLDSSVPGVIYGHLSEDDLNWLDRQLSEDIDTNNLTKRSVSTLVIMHHHTLPVGSRWMDHHILDNPEAFWSCVSKYNQVKAVLSGHVHQLYEAQYLHTKVYATPSTCYQFMPNHDDYTLDENAPPGYRWLQLHKSGSINSWVKRLEQS